MSRSRILLMATLLCVVAASTVVLPVLVVTQETQKPYSEDDVVRLLKGYVPPGRVATLARQRGISFRVARDVETVLPEAGATDDLLEALRALQPPPPPAGPLRITSKAAGAQVYIDNKLQGTTGAQGRFELTQLKPGSYTIRITRAGYQEYQQKVTLWRGKLPIPSWQRSHPYRSRFKSGTGISRLAPAQAH